MGIIFADLCKDRASDEIKYYEHMVFNDELCLNWIHAF